MNLMVKGITTCFTIEWYRIFLSNPNYQSNMTWKSVKMNLIVKGITTWLILQVGFEPWLLSGIGHLYPTQIINQTWLEKV